MSDPKRPWWADREVVEFWVEQRAFGATLTYLGDLAAAVEQKIAYAADDQAAAARAALDDLDAALHDRRVVIVEAWGGEKVATAARLRAGGSIGDRVEQILNECESNWEVTT